MTDLIAIWRRLRKKIDLSKVKGKTPTEWRKNFLKEIKGLDKADNLQKAKGFFKFAENKKNIKEVMPVLQARVTNRVTDQRTIILTGRNKTKSFATKNLKYKEGFFGGKKVTYISNTRTGRVVARISTESTQEFEERKKAITNIKQGIRRAEAE